MNRKSENANHIKKCYVAPTDSGLQLVKKASAKDKKRERKRYVKETEERWANRHTQKDKETFKFGLFNVKGYLMVKGFATRQEAEDYLNNTKFYAKVKHRYEIRELLW